MKRLFVVVCRYPESTVVQVPLLHVSSEDLIFWMLITLLLSYSLLVGVFVATERCVRAHVFLCIDFDGWASMCASSLRVPQAVERSPCAAAV